MNSPSDDIRDMLEADSSLGLEFATDLFVGRAPATPDDCVTVYDTPGFPPALTLGNDVRFYSPSVQICVRNRSYTIGYALANDIMRLLHGRGPETWNDMVYCSIVCASDPALLDWDANNRVRFVVTFNITRRN